MQKRKVQALYFDYESDRKRNGILCVTDIGGIGTAELRQRIKEWFDENFEAPHNDEVWRNMVENYEQTIDNLANGENDWWEDIDFKWVDTELLIQE